MRPPAPPLAAVLVTAALLAVPGPSVAAAGGTPAPAASGGTQFGSAVARPASQPVARELTVTPRRVTEGRQLPSIRFRVDQRGMRRVQARLVVLRVPRNDPVARMDVGWVRTGRRIGARWPRGTRLRSGRYVVRLHVKDSRGRTLKRRAHASGRTVLTVAHAPQRRAAPAPAATPAPPPSSGTGVFPVAGPWQFGGEGSQFGADRGSRKHEGQDITAAEGTPVVAPVAGTVSRTAYQSGGAGEYVVLDGADGRAYFFAHCVRASTAVAVGTAVAPGGRLCDVGNTGASSGAHLHFEIWMVGWRVAGGYPIDPLPDLRAWAGR